MPSNSKSGKSFANKADRKWEPIHFRPSPEDIERINTLFEQEHDFDNLVAELTDGTVKLGMEYKEQQNAYSVSIWETDKSGVNYNRPISTFHVSPYKALCALRVALERVQDGDWTTLLDISSQYSY